MISTENINMVAASLMVEECIRNGVDTFFLAPGSRCTPLTIAVARHPEAEVMQHFDERGLGFAALGYARATGRPGAVICTSGTAVSNLTPSVVEAFMSGVPMVLLTADRPDELRDCGANQAIPQVHAFDPYVTFSVDLPAPDESLCAPSLLQTVDVAVEHSLQGPVHVNCPFREPLAPVSDGTDWDPLLESVRTWIEATETFSPSTPFRLKLDDLLLSELQELFSAPDRVVVIAGGGCTEADGFALHELASQHGWPVISDVTSGLHFGSTVSSVVRHVDALVGEQGFPPSLKPDHVLQFGTRFLSKRLLQALEATDLRSWTVVTPREGCFDPLHKVSHRFRVDIGHFCREWSFKTSPSCPSEWRTAWLQADDRAEACIAEHLDEAKEISEPGIARRLTQEIPRLHGLVLGASMPIRDVNQFAYPSEHRLQVAANRGASGIDGTLATAVGFAKGLAQPVTVLLGDLSTLHDLNSLSLVAQSEQPIVVVVINNHGGGIFHFLPISTSETEFEPYFGTPHDIHFEKAAEMFSISYAAPRDLDEFTNTYQQAVTSGKSWVIEVKTDRVKNVEQHRLIANALALKVKVALEY